MGGATAAHEGSLLFKISDFSRFTRVSVKTLRHYDRLGILVPARVDPATRYRYYAARQAERLQRILALRDLGFSLEHIADILDRDPRRRRMRRLLELRRVELERQIDADRRRLSQLQAMLGELERGHEVALPRIVVQEIPPVKVASRRARVADLDQGVQELFEAVEADAARAGARAAGPPILIYHDRRHPEAHADVEAAVPVEPAARQAGRSRIRTLPGVARAACVVYAGGYDQWTEVIRGLLGWLETRRLSPAGPIREVFLQFSANDAPALGLPREYLTERAEDLTTEMQIPVTSRRLRERARQAR